MTKHDGPAISVVMAVHNGQHYLRKAIESILAQTYADFEFLIVNDGSTDRTDAILTGYADMRIRILRNEQCFGLTRSLNLAIAQAQGHYIARMDADDISLPMRFARQLHFLQHNPEHVAVGAEVLMIDPEGWVIGVRKHAHAHGEINDRLLTGDGGAMTHPVVMMRREAIHAIGGYREQFITTQDFDLFLRLAEVGKLHNLPEILLHWRQHSSSINHTRYHTWSAMKRMALTDAAQRRNITVDLAPSMATYHPSHPDARFRWAKQAFKEGRIWTAAKNYMISLIRHGPRRRHMGLVWAVIRSGIKRTSARLTAMRHNIPSR